MQKPLNHTSRNVFLSLLVCLLFFSACTTSSKKNTPNKPPTVSLTANPQTGEAALEVTFKATTSDPDGDNLTISWDFGDGQTAQDQTERKHTYQNSNVYTAKVTVSDGKGGTANDSVQITVTAKNNDPEVKLTADKTSGAIPLTVNFTANASDVDNDNLTFSWDFGDGKTLSIQTTEEMEEKQSHTYDKVGTYTAKVTVSDDKGNSASDTIEITTQSTPQNKPPTVSLNATPTSGNAPLGVEFTANASDPDGDPLTYSWDFGDGDTTGNKNKETHTYQKEGIYTAKITVSDGNGGSDSDSVEIKVNKPTVNELEAIKDSQNTVCNVFDEIIIYGEVINNSSSTYYSLEVKATVRDKSDQVIDLSSGFVTGTPVKSSLGTTTSGLPPKTKGIFQILTDAPCKDFDTYSLNN